MQTNPYKTADRSALSQRELESAALMSMAAKLFRIKERWEEERDNLDDVLVENRTLWTLFWSGVTDEDCQMPLELRNNVASLAAFVMTRSMELMLKPRPEGLDVLININRAIARGLAQNNQAA